MTSISFEATGTIWNIQFFEKVDLTLVKEKVFALVVHYDLIFSRFNKLSQLHRLNNQKILHNPDSELVDALKLALEMKELTKGMFDPFIGTKLIKLGYGSSEMPSELSADDKHIEDKIVFHPNSIELSQPSSIDLGSFAKGLIVDRVGGLLKSLSIQYFIINAGGDILLTSNQEVPIRLYIEDAITRKLTTQITLKNQALCSSSNEKRTWIHHGKTQSHIQKVSKKTALLGVSVTHTSCMVADLLTSVIFLTDETYLAKLEEQFSVFEYFIQRK
jgi:thiamine biosynthesis lipoprotein ApbE